MKNLILLLFLINLFSATGIAQEINSKKYYSFKEFGYNYKGGLIFESNKWKIIDSVRHRESLEFEGIFPLFSVKGKDTILSRAIVCKDCRAEFNLIMGQLKKNAQHIIIKPDPEDEMTWYDSLNKNGHKVYASDQFEGTKTIKLNGDSIQCGVITLYEKSLAEIQFYERIEYMITPPEKDASHTFVWFDAYYFEEVPVIDTSDVFKILFEKTNPAIGFSCNPNQSQNLLIIENPIEYRDHFRILPFYFGTNSKKTLFNRKGEILKINSQWPSDLLCNGHLLIDTNTTVQRKLISEYSLMYTFKPDESDRNTWFDSSIVFKNNKDEYFRYHYFLTKGNLGVFDITKNDWIVSPNCDSLIIEYDERSNEGIQSYYWPVSYDHHVNFTAIDPKNYCHIISYYFYSDNVWKRYLISENKVITLSKSPFIHSATKLSPILRD